MRLVFSLLAFGLLLFGCAQQQSPPPTVPLTASPSASPNSPIAVATVAAATPVPSPLATTATPTTALPSSTAKPTASTTASPSASASPSIAVASSGGQTPPPPAVSDFADSLAKLASKYFKRTTSVYQPDYDTYAMSDYTPSYRYDLFVRKARYRWTPDDVLTPITSPNNKTMQGLVNTNPSSNYYEYNFKFLCFGNLIELEAKTRDYVYDPSRQSVLGKDLAGLAVDLCGA